jgi:hypothetical protein
MKRSSTSISKFRPLLPQYFPFVSIGRVQGTTLNAVELSLQTTELFVHCISILFIFKTIAI